MTRRSIGRTGTHAGGGTTCTGTGVTADGRASLRPIRRGSDG
jgi:hypothetical protein